MMKKIKNLFLIPLFTLLIVQAAFAEETQAAAAEEPNKEIDINRVSEAFGHLIVKNLEQMGFEFDMNQVIKGLQDSIAGKNSPMDEQECVHAVSIVQEAAFQKLANKNLDEANSFLSQNAQEKGVVEVKKGKLQYRIEKEGTGALVEEHFSPMIRYTGKFIDGKTFGASQEDEHISLDETIPGFKKAIVGMKEGEQRTIFIHPEEGYGMTGYLPPNCLLIFDIEVIKANATPQQEDSLTSIQSSEANANEIADPAAKNEKVIR